MAAIQSQLEISRGLWALMVPSSRMKVTSVQKEKRYHERTTVAMLENQLQGQSCSPGYPPDFWSHVIGIMGCSQAIDLSSRAAILLWHWELKPILNTKGMT